MTRDEYLSWFDRTVGPDGDLGSLLGADPKADREESTGGLVATEGERAPDFSLQTTDGTQTFTLSEFEGDRPVALIFGSYT